MRALPPTRPRAISSAAFRPWIGTRPSCRAATESRHPATSTAPRRTSAGWHDAQSANGSRGWQVRPSRYAASARGSCDGRLLGGAELLGLAAEARRGEERAIGLLRGVVEAPAERVNEDRRPALDDRERVAPELQRDAEAELRGVQGIGELAGEVKRRRRDAHDDRVERFLEHDLPRGDRAQQGLRVRDRGRPREHAGGSQVSPERADHARSKRSRHDRERATKRRARDPLGHVLVVGETAQRRRDELRVVQHQRDADQRDARGERPLERGRDLPALRRGGLEQRPRARGADRLGSRPRR